MKCPNGDHEVIIPEHSTRNADAYGTSNTVRADCCGKPIQVKSSRCAATE